MGAACTQTAAPGPVPRTSHACHKQREPCGAMQGRGAAHQAQQRQGGILLVGHVPAAAWLCKPARNPICFFFLTLSARIPYPQMPSLQALGSTTAHPAPAQQPRCPLSDPLCTHEDGFAAAFAACPGPSAAPITKCVGQGQRGSRFGRAVSSRKCSRAFVSPLPLASPADHPGPGGHHPGEPQLPGLRPPDGGGRLQLGRALPPALVSGGTSGLGWGAVGNRLLVSRVASARDFPLCCLESSGRGGGRALAVPWVSPTRPRGCLHPGPCCPMQWMTSC